MSSDVQLRVLASAILYRACLRHAVASRPEPPLSPHEKMRLHARVEEAAWALPEEMLGQIDGRDVDDGPPATDAWSGLVHRLSLPA